MVEHKKCSRQLNPAEVTIHINPRRTLEDLRTIQIQYHYLEHGDTVIIH